ncbi:MAG: CinA family protein [Nocardioides sp.]|nr:CinA family protein [Nocardioides sp.]
MTDPSPIQLAARVLAGLARVGGTLATAESLTGGQLAAAVTAVPGASAVYLGGVVSYATSVKTSVLRVPNALVAAYGVISPECALAMAQGVAALTGASYAVATTGVAGPDRQEGRPAGTVHVALLTPTGHRLLALHLGGDRAGVQESTCREALAALGGLLAERPAP